MLEIWILNVGKGDSIVLKNTTKDNQSYAIIDSNKGPGGNIKGLDKLIELGAKHLSFVSLTHPHADHYTGLYDILDHYQGNIDELYTFPVDSQSIKRLHNLATIYNEIIKETKSTNLQSQLKEFVRILHYAKNKFTGTWYEATGGYSKIFPVGFSDEIDFTILSPLPKAKGDFFRRIDLKDKSIIENNDLNELSLSFSIIYNGIEVILGGDVPKKVWDEHKQWTKSNTKLNGVVVKLPHHGSKHDCTESVLDYLYGIEGDKYACISAIGNKHHPHEDTLKLLSIKNIKPYCTNLSLNCSSVRSPIFGGNKLDAELVRHINMYLAPSNNAPCQGDIHITISDAGVLDISKEHPNNCLYHDNFDMLFNNS